MKNSSGGMPRCGLCGSTDSRELYFWGEWTSKARLAKNVGIRQCGGCGVWFTWPEPMPMYDEKYDVEYDWQQYKALPVVLRVFRQVLLWIQREGKGFSTSKAHFLDIGCNTGVILEVARALGFAAQGFEISRGAIEVARKKGFAIASNSLAVDISASSCEVVYASHVIEHLANPQELVRQAHRILTPGGYFVLICPNRKGFGPWLRGADHPWDPDVHFYHFSRSEIREFLEAAEFRIRTIFTEDGTVARNKIKILFWRTIGFLGLGDTLFFIAQKR